MNVEMKGTDGNGPSSVGILVSDKKKGEKKGNGNAPSTSTLDLLAYKNLGFQMQVRLWYDSVPIQYFFTGMILLNFIIILISATSWAMDNPDVDANLKSIDRVFVYIFLIELLINMYGNWFWHFWEVSRWNHFDFIVISLSLVSPVMSAVRVARVVRLLRVLRVAGKLEALRTIIATFDRSMGAVGAVVGLLLMLMCIYAVFGVHDYKDKDPENFGDLGRAMFTMFQLVTGENWPELARPLMYGKPAHDGKPAIPSAGSAPFFFVTFMIIAALTTIEVVAAIFLDKMAEAKDYVKEEAALHLQEEKAKEDIVRDRVDLIKKFNAGDIPGEELQDELDRLKQREDAINAGKLNKAQVKSRVEQSKTMRLSMDMAEALRQQVTSMDKDGDGNIDQEEMDLGLIEMLTKISAQMQDLSKRMGKIESATKGKNLING